MYTLIAYKSDSDDYCMGCHMASYSSDFNLHSELDKDETIELYSAYLMDNEFMNINEAGYELTILYNGIECQYYNRDGEENSDYIEILEKSELLSKKLINGRKEDIEKRKKHDQEIEKARELAYKHKRLKELKEELGEE